MRAGFAEWCRSHRHDPVKEQSAGLARRLNGHYNYFGVNGNGSSMKLLLHQVKRAWKKWLSRRGQRRPLSWERFNGVLQLYPLPTPTIRVQLW